MGKSYRPCVVGVFIDARKRLLVGQRLDADHWQFPQGGIEKGESSKEALFREMREELGCGNFSVVKMLLQGIQYDFPPDLNAPIAEVYKGQVQDWYLCVFDPGSGPNLDKSTTREFRDLDWVTKDDILAKIIWWKRAVYERALNYL